MHILRRIALALTNMVFRLLLFFSITIVAVVLLYTDPSYIKTVLEKNNAYERLVPAFIETNADQTIGQGSDVRLGDPEISQLLNEAFPPQDVQTALETIIDSTYRRLDGTDEQLRFIIDLTENQERLAAGLADYATNRVAGLPECTSPTQLSIDPFSAECRPPFLDIEQEKDRLRQQLLDENFLFEDPVITEETLFGEQSGERTETLDRLSSSYSLLRWSWLPVGAVLLGLAGLIIVLSDTKKRGLRKLGGGTLGAGMTLVAFTVIFSFIIPSFTGKLLLFQSNENGLDGLLNDISLTMGRDFAWMTIIVCTPLIIMGLLLLYASRRTEAKPYHDVERKSGVATSSGARKKQSKNRKRPPIQSSESSSTKPAKSKKTKKYKQARKKVGK